CAGLVFLNTGTGTGVGHWVATGNTATHNDNYCPGSVTLLPFNLTGLGILIAGGNHIVLQGNTVSDNQPSGDPTIIDGVALAGGAAQRGAPGGFASPETTPRLAGVSRVRQTNGPLGPLGQVDDAGSAGKERTKLLFSRTCVLVETTTEVSS